MFYAAPSSERSSSEMLADKRWESLSFASTLYLRPVLDALLAPTPDLFHDELRLGLQEALVNAAKHGNRLDPQKIVSVRYAKADGYYWWIVSDQGEGFEEPAVCACPSPDSPFVSECGRGLFILNQVFDQVRWSSDGKEVCLAKQVQSSPFNSMISPAFFVKVIESWWRRWSTTSAHGA
ncbi:MAG: ATP-binding protein [Phormidesmis sp.]